MGAITATSNGVSGCSTGIAALSDIPGGSTDCQISPVIAVGYAVATPSVWLTKGYAWTSYEYYRHPRRSN